MILLFALACLPAPLVDTDGDGSPLRLLEVSCEGADQTERYSGTTVENDGDALLFHLTIDGCALDQLLDLAASEVGPLAGCGLDTEGHAVGWDVADADDLEVTIAGSALGCESTAAPGQLRPTVKLVAD